MLVHAPIIAHDRGPINGKTSSKFSFTMCGSRRDPQGLR